MGKTNSSVAWCFIKLNRMAGWGNESLRNCHQTQCFYFVTGECQILWSCCQFDWKLQIDQVLTRIEWRSRIVKYFAKCWLLSISALCRSIIFGYIFPSTIVFHSHYWHILQQSRFGQHLYSYRFEYKVDPLRERVGNSIRVYFLHSNIQQLHERRLRIGRVIIDVRDDVWLFNAVVCVWCDRLGDVYILDTEIQLRYGVYNIFRTVVW